jgi:uncharacterized protein (DUF4415 family)
MSENKESIKSDLAKLDAMTDADIDYSDIPDMGDAEELWAKAFVKKAGEPFLPLIMIDPEVLAWFMSQGEEAQTRINAVLRDYMEARRKVAGAEAN